MAAKNKQDQQDGMSQKYANQGVLKSAEWARNDGQIVQLAGQAIGRMGSDIFFARNRVHSANGIGRMGSKTGRMGSNPGRMGSFLNRPNGLEKKNYYFKYPNFGVGDPQICRFKA